MKISFKYVIVIIIAICVLLVFVGIWFQQFVSFAERIGYGNVWIGILKIPFALFGAIQIGRAFLQLIAKDLERLSSKWTPPFYIIATIVGIACAASIIF